MPLSSSTLFILAAISAAASATDVCNDACRSGDGTFCGIDGYCRTISCSAVLAYQYNSSASMFCRGVYTDSDEDELPYPSVSYSCKNSTTPPPIQTGFHIKCTANGLTADGSNFEYTCYEDSEGTGFRNFLAEVDGMKCTDDEDPLFRYHITREYRIGSSSFIGFSSVFNETAEFNRTYAKDGTLYSLYTTFPTVAPTNAPVAPTTATSSSSHNSIAASKNWLTMLGVVWLHCSVKYSLLF